MAKLALARLSYPADFTRQVTEHGHYDWVTTDDPPTRLNVVLFGQIMPSSYGTDLSAKGTYKPGPSNKVAFPHPSFVIHSLIIMLANF